MVKFKFFVSTPRGGHYNTHFATNEKRAKDKVEQWNTEFKGTGYSVRLVHISKARKEDLPEHYICW